MCTSLNVGGGNGISQPRLKPGSQEAEVVPILLALSDVARTQPVSWLADGSQLFVDAANPSHNQSFAGRIHPSNLMEFMRFQTTVKHRLVTHHDSKNSPTDIMSAVVAVSIVRRAPRSCRDEAAGPGLPHDNDDDDNHQCTPSKAG